MDLNDLYHRRGVSLVGARLAATDTARRAYGRLARLYSVRIDRLRAALPAEPPEMTPAL